MTMPVVSDAFASEEELAAIARRVLELTLPKPDWTHRAHFAMALWLLARRPDLDVPRVLPDIIRAYNEATGVANTYSSGYHETITQASLRVARSFLEALPERPLAEVANALMDSAFGKSSWPLTYWSKTCLFSVEARRGWVEPDLGPLPF